MLGKPLSAAGVVCGAGCPFYSGYWATADVDRDGDDIENPGSAAAAAAQCATLSKCQAFNSNGYVKALAVPLVSSPGNCMYRKKSPGG